LFQIFAKLAGTDILNDRVIDRRDISHLLPFSLFGLATNTTLATSDVSDQVIGGTNWWPFREVDASHERRQTEAGTQPLVSKNQRDCP
jgi:hypothetical protein